MPIDLNDAGPQDERELIPPSVYRLRARVKAGGEGEDYQLLRAKNGVSLMLKLECTVVEGKEHGKKVWDYVTCEFDQNAQDALAKLSVDKRENLQTSVRMGRKRLRAIIDSAYGLDPNDVSEKAKARRSFDTYKIFDGLVFYAQVEQRPAANGYKASNQIDFIVTPDDPAYQKLAKEAELTLQQELDDNLPF